MNTRLVGMRFWAAVLFLASVLPVLSGPEVWANGFEPVGSAIIGTMDVLTDIRHPVTIARPGTLRITVVAEDTLKLQLYLYDVNGTTTLVQDSAGHLSSRTVERPGLVPGTYFVRLYRTQGQGEYTIQPKIAPVGFPSDDEPNDTVDQAQAIELGVETTGLLGYGNVAGTDTLDWFKVTTDQPGTLSANVTAEDTLSLQLHLYDVNERTVLVTDTSGHESKRAVERAGLAPGTYFVRLYRTQGYGGYTLRTELAATMFASDREPNDTVDQAQAIELGVETTGLLGYGNVAGTDTLDWFKVTTDEPGTLSVSVTAEDALSLQLHLYDANGRTVLVSDTSGHESKRAVERADLAPGTYFVRLYRTQGHGGYRFLVSLTPDAPVDDPGVDAPPRDVPPDDPGVEAPGVVGPPAVLPDPDDDPARQPDVPWVEVPTGWMDVRAGDLCLRVPADWYDNTESGGREAGAGITLLGYWATTPIVQGPGSHFAMMLSTKARLEEDIAQNERDPGMVLVDQRRGSLGGEPAVWYVYELEGELRLSLVHRATPGVDGLYLAVVAVTELDLLFDMQSVLEQIFSSVHPCADVSAAPDGPPTGVPVGTISFTLQGRQYAYPAIGQRDPDTGATGILGGAAEAAVSLTFALVDGPGVYGPESGTTFILQWLAGTPPFSSAMGITYMAMPDFFPVRLRISEYGPVGGMISGTFESQDLDGEFEVERTQ